MVQGYGTPYILWLVGDSSNTVVSYSSDQSSSWTTYVSPSTVVPSVYPDGEEDGDATSTYFYAILLKQGNTLFKMATVDNADQLGD